MSQIPEDRRKIYHDVKSDIEGRTVELTEEQVERIYEAERAKRIKEGKELGGSTAGGGSDGCAVALGIILLVIILALVIMFSTGTLRINHNEANQTGSPTATDTRLDRPDNSTHN